MRRWMKCTRRDQTDGQPRLGLIEGDEVHLCQGELFESPTMTGERLSLADVTPVLPFRPGKFFGLWNNYRAAAEKNGWAIPAEPLYFIKPSTSYATTGSMIMAPAGYDGRLVFEGELGVVVGRRVRNASSEEAAAAIFGFTPVNDVTALDLITRDASFAQWTRAKGCDGFGLFGPVVAEGADARALVVRSLLNGRERQNYPVSDAIFSPAEVVARLSREMTLEPGDLIALGTSLGVAPMKAGATVEIVIDGIGSLVNSVAA